MCTYSDSKFTLKKPHEIVNSHEGEPSAKPQWVIKVSLKEKTGKKQGLETWSSPVEALGVHRADPGVAGELGSPTHMLLPLAKAGVGP